MDSDTAWRAKVAEQFSHSVEIARKYYAYVDAVKTLPYAVNTLPYAVNTLPYTDTFLFQVNSLVCTNCLGIFFLVSALKHIHMKGNVLR